MTWWQLALGIGVGMMAADIWRSVSNYWTLKWADARYEKKRQEALDNLKDTLNKFNAQATPSMPFYLDLDDRGKTH